MGLFSILFSSNESSEDVTSDYKLNKLEEAAKLERSGDWKKLLTFSREWASKEPLSLFAWQGIGDALRKLGKPAEAIPMYRKGLEVVPSHPVDFPDGIFSAGSLWYRLGLAFNDLGEHQKAVEAFLEAARIDPDVVDETNLNRLVGARS